MLSVANSDRCIRMKQHPLVNQVMTMAATATICPCHFTAVANTAAAATAVAERRICQEYCTMR